MHRALLTLLLVTALGSVFAQENAPLRVEVRAEAGNLIIAHPATSASRFVLLAGSTPTSIQTALATNNGTAGADRFVVSLTGENGRYFRVRRDLQLDELPLTTVTASPAPGEAGVAVTRETILRFSHPLAEDASFDTTRLFATAAGRKLLARVELSSDRRTATLFYLENLPSSSRVQVTLDATGLRDFAGRLVDADGDGIPGDVVHLDFDTLTITPVKGTAVLGRIFRSELGPGSLAPTNVIETPLQGVTIEVIGAEETIRTVSDAQGNFRLRDCPAGRFFARIDGRTAVGSQWPDGDYYPVVEKAWEAMAGYDNNLAGGSGTIYLPLIRRGTLQPASATETSVITFPASVLAEHPELVGVEVTVPPNVLVSPDGSRGGRIGIAPVSPARLPEPLPPGLDHVLDISIQTDGAQNFDQPLPVRFPNLPDPKTAQRLPPGAKSALWSYDHDVGAWVVSGPMTVTADGMFIESDAGYGVLKPGWHGTEAGASGSGGGGDNCDGPCCIPGGGGGGDDLAAVTACVFPKVPRCVFKAIGCAATLGLRCVGYLDCVRELKDCDRCGTGGGGGPGLMADDSLKELLRRARDFVALLDSPMRELAELAEEEVLTPIQEERRRELLATLETIFGGPDRPVARQLLADLHAHFPSFDDLVPPSNPVHLLVSTSAGQQRTIAPEGGRFRTVFGSSEDGVLVEVFDPVRWQYGATYVAQIEIGRAFEFPSYALTDISGGVDTEDDGLPDLAELVLGSDPTNPDSDADGIPDGVEVRQGTNPLDGRPVATGVIGTHPLPGEALDVSAFDNRVGVAMGSAGVAVLNVFEGLNPTVVSVVDTPGTALQAACAGDLVAVADGGQGVALLDISVPAEARLLRQVSLAHRGGGETRSVAMAADLVFAGQSGGFLSVVEADTGLVRQRMELGGAVGSLAVEGATLYAIAGSQLWVLPFGNGALEKRSSIEAVAGRVFTGNGRAYVAADNGFRVFDVSDLGTPKLVHTETTTQRNWKQIVPNGSGSGLGVVGITPPANLTDDIYLYDLREGSTAFVTRLETPGTAQAASIFNGLGYVADGLAGLQVVNHLPYDARKQPPTGRLVLSSTNEVTAGGLVVVRAEVEDDVQVRNVEFLLNGERIVTDGNFPFEVVYRAPVNRLGSRLAFTARVSDTGGSSTAITNTPVLQVVEDAEPPVVQIESPLAGGRLFLGETVSFTVTAVDNTGIGKIEIRVDGRVARVHRTSGVDFLLMDPLSGGSHTVQAFATDLSGRGGASEVVPFAVWRGAISREFSVFNLGSPERRGAISREFSVFNFLSPERPGAISREYSVENQAP